MAFGAPSLKGRALRLLSQREHSRAELERKLLRFEEQPGSLAAALDDLQARGYICEERVVQSVLHQRAGQFGAARLRQELLRKGVAPAQAAEAVAILRDSELDRARAAWQKRFGAPAATSAERARQARFLMARGFAGEVVARVLRSPDGGEGG